MFVMTLITVLVGGELVDASSEPVGCDRRDCGRDRRDCGHGGPQAG